MKKVDLDRNVMLVLCVMNVLEIVGKRLLCRTELYLLYLIHITILEQRARNKLLSERFIIHRVVGMTPENMLVLSNVWVFFKVKWKPKENFHWQQVDERENGGIEITLNSSTIKEKRHCGIQVAKSTPLEDISRRR